MGGRWSETTFSNHTRPCTGANFFPPQTMGLRRPFCYLQTVPPPSITIRYLTWKLIPSRRCRASSCNIVLVAENDRNKSLWPKSCDREKKDRPRRRELVCVASHTEPQGGRQWEYKTALSGFAENSPDSRWEVTWSRWRNKTASSGLVETSHRCKMALDNPDCICFTWNLSLVLGRVLFLQGSIPSAHAGTLPVQCNIVQVAFGVPSWSEGWHEDWRKGWKDFPQSIRRVSDLSDLQSLTCNVQAI